jgi:peroxiredoxin Q/BCP
VLNADRGVANRWTFYIDKDGKIVAIDKAVKPPTSAEDMVAKLAELKVATR